MNVFIVEDSELVRTQFMRMLARQSRIRLVGYATEEEQAVSLVLSIRPDAVLLDLSLSPGSGLRVLERIRAGGCGARSWC